MLAHPSVLPRLAYDLPVTLVVLLIVGLAGRFLYGSRRESQDAVEHLAISLVTGLLFVVGLGVTILFHRVGVHSIVPLVIAVTSALVWRTEPRASSPEGRVAARSLLITGLLVTLGITAGHEWLRNWVSLKGNLLLPHSDLGFFAMLAGELPAARVSDSWVGVMGVDALVPGESGDQWYHWGPIWLAMLITKLTGLPRLESLLNVTSSVLCVVIVAGVAALARSLRSMSLVRSVLAGIAALLVTSLPIMLWQSIGRICADSYIPLRHDSLVWNFSYLYEAMQIIAILLCWLRRRTTLALIFTACAAVSSPHFVAGVGPAIGAVMVVSALRRDKALLLPSAAAVGVMLAVWCVLHLIGVKMAGGIATGVAGSEAPGAMIGARVVAFVRDLALGGVFCAALIPGWLAVARQCEEGVRERARLLAWLPVAGMAGSLASFHLFAHAEKFHFTEFPHVTLAIPIAVCGFALLTLNARAWIARVAMIVLIAASAWGVHVLYYRPQRVTPAGMSVADANALKGALHGAPFGYFADFDRPWWLPIQGSLAAALDTRCIRLNPLKDADFEHEGAIFYHSWRPFDVMPFTPAEKLLPWGLKFARKLKIDYVLHLGDKKPPPAELTAAADVVLQRPGFILFKLKPGA